MASHTSGELIGGRYRLGELLGVGGTGSVFAAVDLGAGEPDREAGEGADVAVKLLHPHLCADEASRNAFLREASHVMALQHPNVIRIHGAGLHDAAGVIMPWIALDLLDGPTLRERVDATGPLSPTDAAVLADAMLGGLTAAHAAKIMHRDISPQNVILHGWHTGPLTTAMVRIVDFGLADLAGRSTLGGDVLLTGRADAASAGVVGNAAYMSPEQAQGLPMRAASDLYQVGAVLYFTLTGRVPYPRDTTDQVLQAHISAPLPVPSALVAGARAFDRVVTRAMAKKPVARFRDAEEFREAVRAVALQTGGLQVAPARVDVWGDVDPAGAAAGSGGSGFIKDGGGEGAVPAADPPTRVLGALSETDRPMAYLGTAEVDGGRGATTHSRGGGAAAVVAGVVILGLAGWAVMAAAAGPGAPDAAQTSSPAGTATLPPVESAPTASASMPVTPPPSTPPPADEPPPAMAPVEATVPVLSGTLVEIESALAAVGLSLGTVTRVNSSDAADRFLSQSPQAGEKLPLGARVAVTVAAGTNAVPPVSGMSVGAAAALLQSAGFVVAVDRSGAAPMAVVAKSLPPAGTILRVGVTVTVVVDVSTPTPAPTSTADTGGSS